MIAPLRVDRLIEASPTVVFDAFVSHDGQVAFYGTDDPGWVVQSDCDLRVGGLWTVQFGPSADHLYEHRNRFEAIDRPHRILITTTEAIPGRPIIEFSVEFTFEDHDGATRMTVTQSGFPTDELREEHGRGVPHAFDRFERVIGAGTRPPGHSDDM